MSRLHRNFVYTALSGLAPVLVTVITVPLYLSIIGDQRYGIMAIVWLITGYFSFFEMGMGRALTQRLARMKDALDEERGAVVRTALLISTVLSAIGALSVATTAWFYLPTVAFESSGVANEALRSIPLIALAFVPVVLANTMNGVLQAQERFPELAVVRVVTTTAMQLLPIGAAVLFGPAIENLVAATVLSRMMTLAMSSAMIWTELQHAWRSTMQCAVARDLVSFGSWVSMAGIIGPLLVVSDRFLIGSLVGAAAVAYYTIPYNLAMKLVVIPGSLATVVFPRMSYLSDLSRKALAEKSVDAIQFLLTPTIVAMMLLFEPLLTIWLGAEVASRSTIIGQIILIGVWANCIARIPFAEIQATGRPGTLVRWMLWQIAPYLILLYFALKEFDLIGAATVWSARVLIDTVGLFQIAAPESRYLRINAGYAAILLAAFLLAATIDVVAPIYWVGAVAISAASIFHSWRRAPDAVKRLPFIGRLF